MFGFVVAYDGSLGRRVERTPTRDTALSRGGPTYVGAMLNGNHMEVVGRNTLHAVHISAHRYRTEEVAHATRGRSPGKVSAYCELAPATRRRSRRLRSIGARAHLVVQYCNHEVRRGRGREPTSQLTAAHTHTGILRLAFPPLPVPCSHPTKKQHASACTWRRRRDRRRFAQSRFLDVKQKPASTAPTSTAAAPAQEGMPFDARDGSGVADAALVIRTSEKRP